MEIFVHNFSLVFMSQIGSRPNALFAYALIRFQKKTNQGIRIESNCEGSFFTSRSPCEKPSQGFHQFNSSISGLLA